MKNHYERIKQYLFGSIERYLNIDDLMNDAERLPIFLATGSSDQGLTDGSTFAAYMSHFILAYYMEGSPRYRDPVLLEKA